MLREVFAKRRIVIVPMEELLERDNGARTLRTYTPKSV